ncbi:alanine dehydrogenase [Flavobacteriaceae bacterium Ap0902]|nr:alanine dehydrogenase [Flavobacteriaceae bacterium Ap0902]
MGKKIYTPFSKEELLPREEKLEVATRGGKLKIGIPKEEQFQESRVCLTPDTVEVLVAHGHQVMVETNAGMGAHFTDNQYSEAGAQIAYSKKDVFAQPIVLKVVPPSDEELDLLKPNAFLFSAVQPGTRDREYFTHLSNKKITAIGYEYLEDEHKQLPLVRLISEIAGTTSILIASELLSTSHGGNGVMLGGVSGVRPAEVVIIGAGTVGEFAARSALGLGASVRIFDNSLTRLRRLQNDIGVRIPTSTIDPKELKKALRRSDIAVGAIRGTSRSPIVVSEEMVQLMKPGAVIIDVSIDCGGCFDTSEITTHDNPTFVKHDVIHYGVPNITSRYARTASKALSNFFLSYFIEVAKHGGLESLLSHDAGLRKGVYTYKGRITNQELAQWFDLEYRDLNLLIL